MPPALTAWQPFTRALHGEPLPAAVVDLDALDANIDAIARPVRDRGKKLRVASKSIRCVALLKHVVQRAGDIVSGVMTYTASESVFLLEHGFTNIMLAYPTLLPSDAELLAAANKRPGVVVCAMVDCSEHLPALEAAGARADAVIPVAIDVDMSYRPVGKSVHMGVRRSPLRSAADVLALVKSFSNHPHLKFHGVMGYEAQIAGLTDQSPFSPWMNVGKRWMKLLSKSNVADVRQDLAKVLTDAGFAPTVFNGGGTGSLHWCTQENALTEVTAGSGFLASHLFDYYQDFKLKPAAGFALQVVRRPAPDVFTCHGGGYVASGEAGPDRLPAVWMPQGLKMLAMEGAGEVQTPLKVPPDVQLALGDAVFFRHAKAGELAEHFNEYLLLRGEKIEARAPTYRGMGKCFLG